MNALTTRSSTEVELKEKKHRIEDALSTTRAAVEEGLVAGGGVALLQAIPALDMVELVGDEAVGLGILRRALEAPIRQIADNAGAHGEVIVERVKTLPPGHGFDALKGDYGDMFEVARHPPAADEHLDRARAGADVGPLAHEGIRDAVVVALVLDVIIDAHLRPLPGRVLVRGRRQRAQGRPIELREQARPRPWELLEWPVVQPGDALADRPVRLGREKNVRLRRAARIQRSAMRTPVSTFALSRGL
jgi:hypothetical protein